VCLVYMVMTSQFESLVDPFVVMFSVPFAFTGAIWSIFLGGHHLSIVVFLGLLWKTSLEEQQGTGFRLRLHGAHSPTPEPRVHFPPFALYASFAVHYVPWPVSPAGSCSGQSSGISSASALMSMLWRLQRR